MPLLEATERRTPSCRAFWISLTKLPATFPPLPPYFQMPRAVVNKRGATTRRELFRIKILEEIQYRPSHKKLYIGLRLTFLLWARTKAHFLRLHFLMSMPEAMFSLIVHKHFPHARLQYLSRNSVCYWSLSALPPPQ